MKIWEYAKVEGSSIRVDGWMSDTMGLVDGGIVYSTLFKHPAEGPKDYEIILSMFPQENYRTLTHITMYLDDVPGSSAQAAAFLASREINVLNSISLNGISDTVIVWKLMADLNFAGEGEILRETFAQLKQSGDPSVSKIRRIDIKPAEIGRLFKGDTSGGKEEVRRGYPSRIGDGCFDVADQYGDILTGIDGKDVLVTMDADSWILSITFFKEGTRLVRLGLETPDCPGGIHQVLQVIAGWNVNLISVFSKVKICYETMYLELVMDIGTSDLGFEEIRDLLPRSLNGLNGIYEVKEFTELRRRCPPQSLGRSPWAGATSSQAGPAPSRSCRRTGPGPGGRWSWERYSRCRRTTPSWRACSPAGHRTPWSGASCGGSWGPTACASAWTAPRTRRVLRAAWPSAQGCRSRSAAQGRRSRPARISRARGSS